MSLAEDTGFSVETRKTKRPVSHKQQCTIKVHYLLSLDVEAHGSNTSHSVAVKLDIKSKVTSERRSSTTSHIQTTFDHSKDSAFFVVFTSKNADISDGTEWLAGAREMSEPGFRVYYSALQRRI